MTKIESYKIPEKWIWDNENGGKFSKINKPFAAVTHEKILPKGKHSFQLYSQGTPNGIKVTIMLEELLELGILEADYDAWLIEISKGDQFSSGFVEINPNSKIPALIDYSNNKKICIFESGSILLYLAEKFNKFLPSDIQNRTKCLNWLFWQMSSTPYVGGGFGHFFNYAPEAFKYSIDRYTMETKRQLDLLNKHLANNSFICGNCYTISDIAIWPWYGQIVLGNLYNAAEFLDVQQYGNIISWSKKINSRPAVQKGKIVNKISGDRNKNLRERHSKNDFLNLMTK